jgi:nicotinamide-nucleotide adenylyltransferase
MTSGFYTGRFQPFHNGHLSAVKQALSEVDLLHIGVGSAQYSHNSRNPFTADERIRIIRAVLKENGVPERRFSMTKVPDIHNDDLWVSHVRDRIPPFEMVFVGNKGIVKELFEKEKGTPIHLVRHEVDICASDIRRAMVNDEDWRVHLSPSAIRILEEMKAVERMKEIYKNQ